MPDCHNNSFTWELSYRNLLLIGLLSITSGLQVSESSFHYFSLLTFSLHFWVNTSPVSLIQKMQAGIPHPPCCILCGWAISSWQESWDAWVAIWHQHTRLTWICLQSLTLTKTASKLSKCSYVFLNSFSPWVKTVNDFSYTEVFASTEKHMYAPCPVFLCNSKGLFLFHHRLGEVVFGWSQVLGHTEKIHFLILFIRNLHSYDWKSRPLSYKLESYVTGQL